MGSRPVWLRALLVYVGLFLSAGIAFGVFETLLHDRSWERGLVSGLVFGLVMSAVLGTSMVVGQRGNTGSWSPRRHVTLTVPDGVEVARAQTLIGLEQLGAQVTSDEPTRVSARTGFGMKSWGNRIDVTFEASAAGTTAVHVAVRPRVRTTLIDYGASNRIIEALTYFLTPRPY